MKKLILVGLLAAAAFLLQRRGAHETAPATKAPPATKAASPSTPRPTYEHDWAKHSLDRAHAVVDQVQASREEDNHP